MARVVDHQPEVSAVAEIQICPVAGARTRGHHCRGHCHCGTHSGPEPEGRYIHFFRTIVRARVSLTCMRSAGQVGGVFSSCSFLRRNVSSNPKPLHSPGLATLEEVERTRTSSDGYTARSSLVHSAISVQVREATGDVVPVRRSLLGAVSVVKVHANVVQRVWSTKPVCDAGVSHSLPSQLHIYSPKLHHCSYLQWITLTWVQLPARRIHSVQPLRKGTFCSRHWPALYSATTGVGL